MEEKLNKTIQELAEKLKAAELKITKQEEEAKSYSTTVICQTKSKKVDMIMNFVDHAPYTEILDILKKVYGEKDTWTQMQQNFSQDNRELASLLMVTPSLCRICKA